MKSILLNILLWALLILVFAAIIGLIIFEIHLWITYGNKPVGEIPAWAIWWMFGK